MSMVGNAPNMDEALAQNKYEVAEESHIEFVSDISTCDSSSFDKLVNACPAGLYRRTETGAQTFDFSGCLECGTCRVLCGDTIISRWRNPSAGCGVDYRFG